MGVIVPDSVFESKILDREYHGRLIADLERLSRKAGIPAQYVWSRLSDYCSEEEIAWVRKMRSEEDHGLIITSSSAQVPVECKMMAMVGAFLRNYINARMLSVQEVVAMVKNSGAVPPTVALVPNFSMAKSEAASVAPWDSALLLSWLYSRLVDGQKTVLFVGSMKTLEEVYGEAMLKHLKTHYRIL